MTRVRAVPPVTLEAGGPVQLRKAGTAAAAGKVFRRRKDTTEQADSERYMNTARRQFTGGRAGNITLADGILSEVPEPMESSSAWLGLNEGYRNGWLASRVFRLHIVDMFSAGDKIVTRLVCTGQARPIWRRRGGRPVTTADFAAWRFEGGKVAEISTIQDQLAPL